MSAAVGGVIDTDHDLSWKQVLNSKIPLVDLCVENRAGVQVARVPEAPLRQVAVGGSLRRCEASGKWAGTGGLDGRRPKTRGLIREIVFGEKYRGGLRKCRAGILEVGGDVHPVEDSHATAQHSIGGELIGEPEARSPIVSVHLCGAVARSWKRRGSPDSPNLPKLRKQSGTIAIHRNIDSCGSTEIIELKPVVALGVGSAPFVAQTRY